MFHLDIPKTRQYDTGKVEVYARNSVGEAIASTELKVVARSDDYRGVLKNSPRRKYYSILNEAYFVSCQTAILIEFSSVDSFSTTFVVS